MRTSNSPIERNSSLRLSIPTAPLALPPPTDARRGLGSPDRRAGAKRLRGLTAPISPTNYPKNHRINISHECIPPRTVCTIPLPLPAGGTSPGGRGKGLCANFEQLHRPKFIAPSTDALRTLGSPSGRAGAKRLRGITAPISPTNYLRNYRTDSTYIQPTEPPH